VSQAGQKSAPTGLRALAHALNSKTTVRQADQKIASVVLPEEPNATFRPAGLQAVNQIVGTVNSDITIVTAYFKISSKHSTSEYKSWMANMLSLTEAMVIFTTLDMKEDILKLRSHARNRTKVVLTTLKETSMAKRFSSRFWGHQHSIDREKRIHNINLYWIWNEKSNFLKQAADINPFQSSFLAWVDIGYFRTKTYNGKRMILQIPKQLKEDQIMLLDISPLAKGFYGGGFIGGFKPGIERWHKAYYATFEANMNGFVGSDQPLMYKTCQRIRDICLPVKFDKKHGDPWFFMTPYLRGLTKDNVLSKK